MEDGEILYSYNSNQPEDAALLQAAQSLGSDAQASANGRNVLLREKGVDGRQSQIFLFGGNTAVQSMKPVKIALTLCALAIGLFSSLFC